MIGALLSHTCQRMRVHKPDVGTCCSTQEVRDHDHLFDVGILSGPAPVPIVLGTIFLVICPDKFTCAHTRTAVPLSATGFLRALQYPVTSSDHGRMRVTVSTRHGMVSLDDLNVDCSVDELKRRVLNASDAESIDHADSTDYFLVRY